MSVRIPLNILTEDHKKIIREKLFLQPKKTNFTQNKFGPSQEKDPVLFYWIDKPKGEIVLPYTFANVLLQRHVNSTLTFPPGSYNFTGKLRDYQIPIIQEALTQLSHFGTTSLCLGTGLGKTVCSIVLGSYLMNNGTGGLMLILVNRETIKKGWYETIINNTNCGDGVWDVESKIKIPEKCNIILCMDGRFEKIPWEIRKLVSILVIDEAHLFCTSTQVPVLLGTCPKYIVICSATLQRPDQMEKMIYNIAGTHEVNVPLEKKFTVYKICTGIVTEYKQNKQGTTNFSELSKELAFNPVRNAIIIDILEQNPKQKFIVLCSIVEHVKLLVEVLKNRGHSVDFLSGRKSTYVDNRILIGTVSKISTGFDSKNVSLRNDESEFDGLDIDSLVLACSTKSYNLHKQSIGRAFRSETPKIYDICDSDRIAKSHWRERKKNYTEMNSEIIEVHVSNDPKSVNIKEEISQKDIDEMHAARLETHRKAHQIESNNKLLEEGNTNAQMHAARLKALREKLEK